ncbi:MAG: GNAT family N-acetyltransferase [Clostridia bacterium]|nr:GNAT family N-acetyltransferase [Clostridia bacterium]
MSEIDAIIRPFAEGDRDMVNEFFDQMGPETRFYFNSTDHNRRFAMKFWDETDEEKRKTTCFYAATIPNEDGGELMVGYVFLWGLDTKVPSLGICTRDGYKGKHLGKRLMETARQHAINAGCGGITLTTHFANIRGQALYKKCGYERLGTHSCGSEFLFLLRLPND